MNRLFPFLDIVVTARPSWSRVKTVLTSYIEIAGVKNVRLSLIGPAVSPRYGDLSTIVPRNISVKTHPSLRDSDDLASVALSCLNGSQALAHQWNDSRPDCVLVIADRSETLGVSTVAALMQIPLIHLQGGEISGSIDDKVRDANSKLADLHLTTNSETKKYLEGIGESSDSIFIVGCPSIDLVQSEILSTVPNLENLGGVGADIDWEAKFGIIMFHPDTLESEQSYLWIKTIIDIVAASELQWVWFWPNPDYGSSLASKLIRSARESGRLRHVRFLINLPPEQFIALAIKSSIMIGNSSFGIREASFIGLPVLNLGTRQKGRQSASNVTHLETIDTTQLMAEINNKVTVRYPRSSIYGQGYAGRTSARIISEWNPKVKHR